MASVAELPAPDAALPTLLFSRPRALSDEADKRRPRRPAPASLELPEDAPAPAPAAAPAPAVAAAKPQLTAAAAGALRVRNTFIDGAVPPSPSMEDFLRERAVQTCPSRHAGRVVELLEELAAADRAERAERAELLAAPLPLPTPCGYDTPLALSLPSLYGAPWDWSASYDLAAPAAGAAYGGYAAVAGCVEAPAGGGACGPGGEASTDASTRPGPSRTVLSLEAALAPETMEATYTDYYYGLQPVGWTAPMGGCDLGGLSLGASGAQTSEPLLYVPPAPPGALCTAPAAAAPVVAEPQYSPPPPAPAVAAAVPRCEPQAQDATEAIPPPPAAPAPGSDELPSVGSADHATSACKPCAFLHTKGCNNGVACRFCHLCGPDERRRRQKEKIQQLKEERRQRKEGQP